jgi:hypothetical protein
LRYQAIGGCTPGRGILDQRFLIQERCNPELLCDLRLGDDLAVDDYSDPVNDFGATAGAQDHKAAEKSHQNA